MAPIPDGLKRRLSDVVYRQMTHDAVREDKLGRLRRDRLQPPSIGASEKSLPGPATPDATPPRPRRRTPSLTRQEPWRGRRSDLPSWAAPAGAGWLRPGSSGSGNAPELMEHYAQRVSRIFTTSFRVGVSLLRGEGREEGRTKEDLHRVIGWLTGFDEVALEPPSGVKHDVRGILRRGRAQPACVVDYRHGLRGARRERRRPVDAEDPLSGQTRRRARQRQVDREGSAGVVLRARARHGHARASPHPTRARPAACWCIRLRDLIGCLACDG